MAKAPTNTEILQIVCDGIAEKILKRANDGYLNQAKSGYPPFAMAPWDDRIRWSAYVQKCAAAVLLEVLSPGFTK